MIRIHRSSTKGWTQVQNTVLRDVDLSLKAKGLLVQLLSHEDGWQQSISFCLHECSDGRDSVRAGLRELELAGYVLRTKRQGPQGRWVWDHEVSDSRIYAGTPSVDSPSTDAPRAEKASIDVEAPDVEPLDVNPLTEPFAEFWTAYPVHDGKTAAKRNYVKALRTTPADVILAGAVRYAAWLAAHPDPPKTKWAQGWLTDRRWEDELAPPATRNGHEETTEERLGRLDRDRSERVG